jgi:hypothetical protein
MVAVIFIIMALVIVIASHACATDMDRCRISNYFRDRGWTLLGKERAPYGPGWYGDRDRIYRVTYRDPEGRTHRAFLKTSMASGVYLTEDEVEGPPPSRAPAPRPAPLPQIDDPEKQAMREEIVQLRQRVAELEASLRNSE